MSRASDFLLITQAELQKVFQYVNGRLVRQDGKPVGNRDKSGYYKTNFRGRNYRVHRLIFLFHYGYLPPVVAHDDGDRGNNKIENLKDATYTANNQDRGVQISNTTGYKGVEKRWKRYGAQIKVNGKTIRSEIYNTIEEAAHAYDDLVEKYFEHGFRIYNFPQGRPR